MGAELKRRHSAPPTEAEIKIKRAAERRFPNEAEVKKDRPRLIY
jgi:hypothetical protein